MKRLGLLGSSRAGPATRPRPRSRSITREIADATTDLPVAMSIPGTRTFMGGPPGPETRWWPGRGWAGQGPGLGPKRGDPGIPLRGLRREREALHACRGGRLSPPRHARVDSEHRHFSRLRAHLRSAADLRRQSELQVDQRTRSTTATTDSGGAKSRLNRREPRSSRSRPVHERR